MRKLNIYRVVACPMTHTLDDYEDCDGCQFNQCETKDTIECNHDSYNDMDNSHELTVRPGQTITLKVKAGKN